MKRKLRKPSEVIEHRGNVAEVASKFRLEMRLVRNINREKPVYSFEADED